MNLREFYKSHYALEVTRKADLTAALSLPAGVLSVLIGALVVMTKELHLPLSSSELVQLCAVILSSCACVFSVYFLFRSLFNYTYGYAPTPLELKKYKEELTTFHQSNRLTIEEASALAETETLEYIDTQYAINADRNSKNNDIKSSYLHRANGLIISAVTFAAIAGVAYVVNSISSPQSVQKFELINLKELKTMTEPANASSLPPAQPRPEPPPSRVIKEDKGPPKPPPPKPKPPR